MNVQHWHAHGRVLLATLLVAGSFIISARLAPVAPPASLTLLRFVLAAALLLPWVLYRRERRGQLWRALPRGLLISLFFSLFFILMFEALHTTTALNTGALFTLVPALTGVAGIWLLGSRLTTVQGFSYLLGMLGALWVIFEGSPARLLTLQLNPGDQLFLLAVLSMCAYSISMKLLYRNDPVAVLTCATLLGGAFWMGLIIWLTGTPLQWQALARPDWLAMIYLVVFATLTSGYLFQGGSITLGPQRVMAYTYLNPAMVALLLWLLDGEPVAARLWPGILLSCLATWWLQRHAAGRRSAAIPQAGR
ncbi:DMT family transporter [Oceanimonas baumannii]|uniref:EamA-like transporter family protein n=1 Tax=Oceanimonas baumannii TaxID=129578 RepID=A0A235CFN2_9GAMM|nr:DMT family transporter [Oceanimonas baumannii]OYD23353.1 hypothetical protein B6S09_12905 [Oceanimonas baumannii]TDW58497.1 EamA-like transporter family protein [Oceanimonas baumannii]